MPRNGAGTYTLPGGNPVVTGTQIAVTWANTTMDDLRAEMTDSLSRSGKGDMLAALKIVSGTQALPGLAFGTHPSSGLYNAGGGVIGVSVLGARIAEFNTTANSFRIFDPNGIYESPLAVTALDGRVVIGGAREIGVAGANTTLTIRGNIPGANIGPTFRVSAAATHANGGIIFEVSDPSTVPLFQVTGQAAGSTFTNVLFDTAVTRTAGFLLEVRNSGAFSYRVDFNGETWRATNIAHGENHVPVTADIVEAAGTLTDILTLTGLIPGKRYAVRVLMNCSAAASTTGVQVQATAAAGLTATSFSSIYTHWTTTALSVISTTALDTLLGPVSSPGAGQWVNTWDVNFVVSNTGSLRLQFKTEVPGSAVTVHAGSRVIYRQVTL